VKKVARREKAAEKRKQRATSNAAKSSEARSTGHAETSCVKT